MDNTEKLLRAYLKCEGYEITELDAKPCPKQLEGGQILYDGGDYIVTKKNQQGIRCLKCGTHLAINSPLNACLCGNSNNLERIEHSSKAAEPIFMTDKEAQHLRNVQLRQMVDNIRDPHEFDECSL